MGIEYFLFFFLFSLLYIFIKSSRENQINLLSNQVERIPMLGIYVLKVIPAFISVIFVIFMDNEIFNVLISLALIFCLIGDITIMQKLSRGVIFFSLAQITFISAFILKIFEYLESISLEDYLVTYSLIIISIVLLAIIIIVLVYIYLDSDSKEFEKYKKPILFYSALLIMLICSTTTFWLFSNEILFITVVLGAFLFLISDSIIVIREFHHKPKYSVIKVMGTYYLSIFLLSLAVI